MAKPPYMELGWGRNLERIAILFEDRSALAVDKPPGWMLVPFNWQKTGRNLQAAIQSSIGAGAHWARSRNIRFLRYVHRLDAETSGILLLGKTPGSVRSLGRLFESRSVHKRYLAICRGSARYDEWTSRERIAPDPENHGVMRIDRRNGKPAETRFRIIQSRRDHHLVEARPVTGRTHQIRLHLAHHGLPVLGDPLYGPPGSAGGLALRAVELQYRDPFTRKEVHIRADEEGFLSRFGFAPREEDSGRGV